MAAPPPTRKRTRPPGSEKLRKGLVEAELLERAARLFAERGYAATSLEDVARETGLSRPALYYYFASKEDVLARLVGGLITSSEAALKVIHAAHGEAPDQRLRVAVEALLGPVIEAPSRFRLLITYETELPAGLSARYLDIRRQIVREVTTIVSTGIQAGVFRPVNERVATFTILGMCNWPAWWYEPARSAEVTVLATEVADMAIASLKAERTEAAPPTRQGLIKAIRDHLGRLEKLDS